LGCRGLCGEPKGGLGVLGAERGVGRGWGAAGDGVLARGLQAGLLTVELDELHDRGTDQDLIARLEARDRDALAIHECAVRALEILQDDLPVERDDLRVPARHHVLVEDHVELAAATDHDLAVRAQGELATLEAASDESKRESTRPWNGHARPPQKLRLGSTALGPSASSLARSGPSGVPLRHIARGVLAGGPHRRRP
jgi:hypothetical protein